MTGRKKMAGIFKFSKEKFLKKIVEINLMKIKSNSNKIYSDYSDTDLAEIVDSVARDGVIRPICVRKKGDTYEILDGEKRFRAAKICGYTSIPCMIRELNDRNYAIYSLVENIRRQDMNFFEEAEAIEELINIYGLTQDNAALKLGRAQSTIANKLRLLRLTEKERELIIKFELTERHARSLLRLGSPEERIEIINKIIQHGLNVERTEKLIDEFIGSKRNAREHRKSNRVFRDVVIFVNAINNAINTMKTAGITMDSKKIEDENYIEYRFRMPIDNKISADL